MISVRNKGNFKNTENFLSKASKLDYKSVLDRYGQQGVIALSLATPVDSGTTANSWSYNIIQKGTTYSINWYNSNVVDGVSIAILIQYGHGTNNGGYVQGRDYINPAIQPIFEKMANEAWKEVVRL